MRDAFRPAGAGIVMATMVACSSDVLGPDPVPSAAKSVATAAATSDYTVAVFYVIPRDIPFEQAVLDRLRAATEDVQAWYQCATGGVTWEPAFPEVVRVYRAEKTLQEYVDGVYYSDILAEMQRNGLPVLTPGSVAALWSRGAGFFAGANPACEGECGVLMLGIEAFPEFNRPEWSGGICPPGEGVAAFPCTPVGAFAHELGHALASLPHPFGEAETRDVAFHSVMQSHWNYPTFAGGAERPWGFLTVERQALRASPFLKEDVELLQPHDCDVVNLPDVGAAPTARFEARSRNLTVHVRNRTKGATLLYWTFGDGTVSNSEAKRVEHSYAAPGTYTITLRASSDESVMDLARHTIEVSARGTSVALSGAP